VLGSTCHDTASILVPVAIGERVAVWRSNHRCIVDGDNIPTVEYRRSAAGREQKLTAAVSRKFNLLPDRSVACTDRSRLDIPIVRNPVRPGRKQQFHLDSPVIFRGKQTIELIQQLSRVALSAGDPLREELSVDADLLHAGNRKKEELGNKNSPFKDSPERIFIG